MQFLCIPRGSIAAVLTVTDLVSRSECPPYRSSEMRHAVAVISRYLMDADYSPDPREVNRSLEVVGCLYDASVRNYSG